MLVARFSFVAAEVRSVESRRGAQPDSHKLCPVQLPFYHHRLFFPTKMTSSVCVQFIWILSLQIRFMRLLCVINVWYQLVQFHRWIFHFINMSPFIFQLREWTPQIPILTAVHFQLYLCSGMWNILDFRATLICISPMIIDVNNKPTLHSLIGWVHILC